MKTRKMWMEETRWQEGDGNFRLYSGSGTYPVLVTDASDMPDFEPGDRVRMPNGDELDVEALYRDRNGGWCVAAYRTNSTKAVIVSAACLTKIPREKTVTLRVTGPENKIEEVIRNGRNMMGQWARDGVRVERVEEEDPDE